MNEAERQELESLKSRQAELLGQLTELGRKLEAFEQRISAAPAVPTPVTPQPQSAATPAPIPAPESTPAPPPIPPVIPPPTAQPALFPQPRPKEFQPRPIAPVVEPMGVTAGMSSVPETPAPPRATEKPKKGSFEMVVGTYWLVRIGIVMLLTSLVFFGTYAYQNFVPRLGAGGKVGLLYLASGALLAVGGWLYRRQEALKNYAQVLLAGGLAAVYFTTYAAHHFPNLEIIHGALLDGALLLGWAGFIIWLADRRKSEILALFAVLLAYYTSVITHAGLFTLYSNLVLTAAAVFFLVRNRWATVTFASLAATYLSYIYWRFFHAGQWQWANPGEGLWTGTCFLMGYWLVFSAAVFLSREETFKGERRTGFLTLNNGVFFTAFLLTMLQVHHGGFWKFSLIYGAVLLGLSALARQLLIKDKLASDAYLTQGLLLVTLGFLMHFTGFKLALVLGVESVILLQLGQMLKSRVMQAGSLITGALAAGWAVTAVEPFDRNGLLTAIAVGGLMLYNAFCIRLRTTYEQSVSHARTIFYTALTLATWFTATWQNCHPQWRGLAIACESAAFLLAARPLRNQVLRYGSWLFAGLSLGWELNYLGSQLLSIDLPQRTGLPQAVVVGGLMIFNALWEQRTVKLPNKQTFQPSVSFFSALGLFSWLLATVVFTPRPYLAPLLAVEALAFTVAWYPVRLKELAAFGQVFLLLSQALWLHDAAVAHPANPYPWWNPVTVIAISLGLAAWWQRQKSLPMERSFNLLLQGLYALAVVGVLFYWLEPQFTAPVWLAFASMLAIGVTLYAVFNRFWLLAAAGQIFMVVSAWQFCRHLLEGGTDRLLPLVPIAALCVLSFGAIQWFQRRPDAKAEVREPILGLALVYRAVALLMSLWWVHKYIPARENFWVLTALGLALFLLAGWRRNRELLLFSAAFTAVGILKFVFPTEETVYWPNFAAILVLVTQQQLARRKPEQYLVPDEIQAGVIVVGGLCLWLLVSRWILQQTSGFYLTVGWSMLALVLFIGGMASRERVYRWLGLAVLACALGRVVIFDVWKLETLYRIFTFMALGLVLLILGFIYNKYQEKIKEWL